MLLGSPRMQWSNFSPRSAAQCRSLMVPLTAMPSSSPVIRSDSEPSFGLPPLAATWSSAAATKQAMRALHVDGAAAVKPTTRDLAAERRMLPRRLVARRHHVGMAGEHEIGFFVADPREQVLDRRGAGLGKRHAVNGKSRFRQQLLQIGERPTLLRRDRPAADKIASDGDGIGGHRRVIASAAKQSSRWCRALDCFVASLLAMTTEGTAYKWRFCNITRRQLRDVPRPGK